MTIIAARFVTHIDEQTGREVRRFPNLPDGAFMSYFRTPKRLPDNRIFISASGKDTPNRVALLHPETGECEELALPGMTLKLRESDGIAWCLNRQRELWQVPVLGGDPVLLAQLPEPPEVQGRMHPANITCDGRYLILVRAHEHNEHVPIPYGTDVETLWSFFNRPRDGGLYSYDLHTGQLQMMVELDGMIPNHVDASPVDPTLVRFCHDKFDAHCQRIWTVRVDGSGLTKIRPQAWNEMITHEFWWADGQAIGFKYQDRREDPTVHDLPWAEYSPTPTRFGLADLAGKQIFESEPLNHYHSHVFVSADGTMICGEGTHDHSFIYLARFDKANPKVDFKPMATIHTPYTALAGQEVNAGFTADGRWLLYNDTVEGRMQVCAVRVDI
ncbi:MAG: oligogalacturonate lyase family protein [Armatimonadota bacterium]